MEPGYIEFRAEMGKWKTAQKMSVGHDLTTLPEAFVIAHATQGVDGVVEECLRNVLDMGPMDQVLTEARGSATLGHAFTVLASRKFGKLLATLTEKEGWQAKEKKFMQELLRLHATRHLTRHFGVELNYAKPSPVLLGGSVGLKEGAIQFVANYPAWKCVKKFRAEETTNRRTVAEFMTSYTITLDLRFEAYLRTLFDLSAVDAALTNAPGKGAPLSQLVDFVNGAPLKTAAQKAGKNEAGAAVVHTYAVRKALKENGIFVDYSQAKNLPGWKRVMGKRK